MRRKDFILERNLLCPNSFEDFSPEESAICQRYDVFMRFHNKEEHEDLLHRYCGASDTEEFKNLRYDTWLAQL